MIDHSAAGLEGVATRVIGGVSAAKTGTPHEEQRAGYDPTRMFLPRAAKNQKLEERLTTKIDEPHCPVTEY